MSAEAWLGRLAGYGLPGAPPLPAPPDDVAGIVHAATGHRLLGMVAAATADGALRCDAADRRRVAEAHEHAMREVLLLEEALLDAVAVLDLAGVDHRVLKGAALAHLVHSDPAERCFGDNDLLIAAHEIDAAVAALTSAGAVRPVPPLAPGFDRRFAKSVTLRWRGASELDVHRTLAPGPYGFMIRLDDLAGDPIDFGLAGATLRTLPIELHLLHAALHVALGDVEARLGNVRDLALLARRDDVDVARIVERAARWGCQAPVAAGLRVTAVLGHERSPLEEWARAFRIGPQDRRRLEVYRRRRGRFRRQALASLRVLGWRDRPAFTRALVVPSAANRAARASTGRPRAPGRRSG